MSASSQRSLQSAARSDRNIKKTDRISVFVSGDAVCLSEQNRLPVIRAFPAVNHNGILKGHLSLKQGFGDGVLISDPPEALNIRRS